MLEERIHELKEAILLLSKLSAGLKSGLSPELSLKKAIENHTGTLKPLLAKIEKKLALQSTPPPKLLKQLSQKTRNPRLRAAIQVTSTTLQKNATKAGKTLEEIISILTEDLKLLEERKRQLKAQEIKLKTIILTSAIAQGTLSALIPQLKTTLSPLTPEQTWTTPIILAATLTATTYLIARATTLNPTKTPLTALTLFTTAYYITSTLTQALQIQTILNTITWLTSQTK
ncbi:MAG: hypothetical protein QXX87_04970 [Candidatus Jordarchaeales archaeon]